MNRLFLINIMVGLMLAATPALGVAMMVDSLDDPNQDVLRNGLIPVHELGNKPPFPDGEWITSSDEPNTYRPCLQNPDDPGISNPLVTITNQTGIDWYWLYYVADPETTLTNMDGTVNGCLAFQIDKVGKNTPLVYESIAQDQVFEPGETWKFVIQDYSNTTPLPASAFGSIGVGNGSGKDTVSSGSIIPEPATALLLVGGALALIRRRR
jgi:hypothetical protein